MSYAQASVMASALLPDLRQVGILLALALTLGWSARSSLAITRGRPHERAPWFAAFLVVCSLAALCYGVVVAAWGSIAVAAAAVVSVVVYLACVVASRPGSSHALRRASHRPRRADDGGTC